MRTLELAGLLAILTVSAGVYVVAGAAAFGAVTAVTASLFAVWRAGR
ncbi:hypothetical protein [Streptomyces sp. URMC 129]